MNNTKSNNSQKDVQVVLMPSNVISISDFSPFLEDPNLWLLFNKYLPLKKEIVLTKDQKNPGSQKNANIDKYTYSIKRSKAKLKELLLDNSNRLREIIAAFNKQLAFINDRFKNFANSYTFKTKSNLIVGLGITSVLESSMRLHYIYGVPCIPSSAIKGVLRAYKLWELIDWDISLANYIELVIGFYEELFEENKTTLLKKLEDKITQINSKKIDEDKKKVLIQKLPDLIEILRIFGTQNKKGSLIVLDAFPEKFENSFDGFIDLDILNNHYPDYYSKNEPPADWHNPNPVTFFVIPKGIKFNFYFLNTYNTLASDLEKALNTLGIGSKTALGYGILEKFD